MKNKDELSFALGSAMPQEDTYLAGIPLSRAADFISAMEAALASEDRAFLDKTMPILQDLIDRIQREVFVLSQLQLRACQVRDEHAPLGSAEPRSATEPQRGRAAPGAFPSNEHPAPRA